MRGYLQRVEGSLYDVVDCGVSRLAALAETTAETVGAQTVNIIVALGAGVWVA